MSIEAGYHKHRFLSVKKGENEAHAGKQKTDSKLDNSNKNAWFIPVFEDSTAGSWSPHSESAKPELPANPCTFRYNPLHDIESLWWLLVYLLLYRPPVIEGDTAARIASQSLFYRPFFIPGDTRLSVFVHPFEFTSHGDRLHEALQPISDALNRIRILLVNRYIEVEQGDVSKIDHTVAADLVPMFMDTLAELEKSIPREI